ncbi:hypothetical protein [Alloprevotella tannerae]|uniref:hypothetical protein n=1 Tax=Alloprevotella tannerae TaxID=76122 RepID=UPI0028E8BBDD|nr:hypothetical protein [Alloprevotella tannerae]
MQIVVYKQPPALSPPNTSPDKLDFSKLLHEAAGRKGTSCDRRRVCKIAESAVSGSNRGTAPHGSRTAEKKHKPCTIRNGHRCKAYALE